MKTINRILALAVTALVLHLAVPLKAMFAPLSDRELLDSSSLIVQAEYLGRTEVNLGGQGGSLSLGVLQVREVLKGTLQDKVVLIALPSPTGPKSSSDISFQPGQTGLWLLRARPDGAKGVYLADHPQRFVPAAGGQERVEALKKALRDRK